MTKWRSHHSIHYIRKPHAVCKLHGYIFSRTAAISNRSFTLREFALFCSCDLNDLDPITFIHELDPYPLKMYPQTNKWTFYVNTFESYRITYIHCVPKKFHLLFFKQLCQKLTDFNDFWCVKSWENLTSTALYLPTLPVYCIATLPWKIQKKSFSTVLFIHTSDYLCYLRKKKQIVTPLPTTPEKCHRTTL